MRILVLFTSRLLASRGTPSRSRNLTRALSRQPGNRLVVLSGDPAGSVTAALDVEHESLAGADPAARLAAAVKRFRPQLLYGQTDKAERLLAACPPGSGLRIVDLHGDLAAEKLEQSWRPRAQRWRAFTRHRLDELRWRRRMDGFTVVTEALARRVGRLGKPTEVLWGGVDPELFAAPPPAPSGRITVAYAGNFRPYQGLEVLVDAVAGLDERYHLLLVGDPTGGEELLERARRTLGGRLEVRDPVPYTRVPALLAAADVLTVPRPPSRSARFGFPSKLPEYLALGRAVVVTDVGEQARVIRDGVNGLVVAPGSPEALAAALSRLADAALRRRLGESARHCAENVLSWQRIGLRLQRFFDRLIAGREEVGRLEHPAAGRV